MDLHRVDVLDGPPVSRRRRDQRDEGNAEPRCRGERAQPSGALARRPRTDRHRQREHREREEMDRIAAFLKRGATVGRQDRHAERVRQQRQRDQAERAPGAQPSEHEGRTQGDRQEPVGGCEPHDPLAEERQRPSDPCQRRGLVDAAEPADEAALDLGRRGGGVRRADRREAEQDHRRQEDAGHRDEYRDPADRQRAREHEEDHEEERLGPGQDRERRARCSRQHMVTGVGEEGAGRQERGERNLHARQCAPGEGSGPQERDRRDERDLAPRAPGERRPSGQEPRADRHADAQRLGHREGGPDDQGARREQQGPQRRGRPGDRRAGIEREARALGEVAREVQVDPRVIQRKPGSAGDLTLAEREDRQRDQRGGGDNEIIPPPPDVSRDLHLTQPRAAPEGRCGGCARMKVYSSYSMGFRPSGRT